jgi:branched-chain amino acid transport system permease protein
VGTTFGPIAGAVFLIALENYLGQLGSWVTVVEGTIFIVCVLAFRRGIFGELSRLLKREL